jgi:hypothetical protein
MAIYIIDYVTLIGTGRGIYHRWDVLKVPTRRYQQQTSRAHKLVDYAKNEDTDKHENQCGDDFGEGIHTTFAVLLRLPRSGLNAALLQGQATSQARKGQALGKSQLVQGLRERIGANRTSGGRPEQGVL